MKDFFDEKRKWSKYKDFILDYYLEPYIAKVKGLRRPILIVDGFAGRGEFRDGEPGSPLIIARKIEKWRENGVSIRGLFIEADLSNYSHLSSVLQEHRAHTEVRLGSFDDQLAEIATLAKNQSVFLYVDPYSVRGLVFERMKSVYDRIRTSSSSVEVLLNFNAATFMRWALAAVQRHQEIPEETGDEALDQLEDFSGGSLELNVLNSIAGGEYWKAIATNSTLEFTQKLERFTEEYKENLRAFFNHVVSCQIKAEYHHKVPKYLLVYGSRNDHGLELIDDAMCKARREFLGAKFNKDMLFDLTPEKELPNLSELGRDLLDTFVGNTAISRRTLRVKARLKHLGEFEEKDYNDAITALLKSGKLYSFTGKTRINDEVMLSQTKFLKNT